MRLSAALLAALCLGEPRSGERRGPPAASGSRDMRFAAPRRPPAAGRVRCADASNSWAALGGCSLALYRLHTAQGLLNCGDLAVRRPARWGWSPAADPPPRPPSPLVQAQCLAPWPGRRCPPPTRSDWWKTSTSSSRRCCRTPT